MALNRAKILREAERFAQQGRFEQAIGRFQLLLEENPRDVSTVNKVGDLYARLGKVQDAVRHFMTTAQFYAADGFLLKAIAIYKKVIKLAPDHLDAFLKLGDLYHQQGLPTEAKTQYLSIAERFKRQGDLGRAVEVYRRIVGIDAADLPVRLQMADLQIRQGNTKQALEEYSKVGEELCKKGRSEEYEKILEKALQADPSHGVIARSLARLYWERGEAPRAVSLARRVADARPQDEDAVALLAETYLQAGSPAEVVRILAEAPVALVQGSPDLQALLGRARLALGKEAEGSAALEAAADAWQKRGDSERALGALQDLVSLRPGQADPLRRLLDLHRQRGEIESAGRIGLQLAGSLREAGAADEARSMLEELLRADPENAEIRAALEGFPSPPASGKERNRSAAASMARSAPEPPEEGAAGAGEAIEIDLTGTEGEASAATGPERGETSAEIAGEDFQGDAEGPGRATALGAPPAPEEEEDEEYIQERNTEAEVFFKYRLIEKAVERLGEVLRRYPRNLATNERLFELYLDEGDREHLAAQTLRFVDLLEAAGDRNRAGDCLRRALEAHPDHPGMRERLKEFGGGLEPDGEEGSGEGFGPEPVAAAPTPAAGSPGVARELEIDLDLDALPGGRLHPAGDERQEAEADGSVRPLQERLREIDFFLEQELLDEARGLLEVMRIREGDLPEVVKRWEYLEQMQARVAASARRPEAPDIAEEVDRALGGGAKPAGPRKKSPAAGKKAAPGKRQGAAPAGGKPERLFDLGSELKHELARAEGEEEEEEEEILKGIDVSQEGHTVEELFRAFRKGVEEQVEQGDFETHYQLGIAYREMGLVDEAIGEFQYAAKDPKMFLDCCSILGLCFREKGMLPLAISWYRKALKAPGYPEEGYLGVRYDLAQALLQAGEEEEARKLLVEVYGVNSNYRDVAQQLRNLREKAKAD